MPDHKRVLYFWNTNYQVNFTWNCRLFFKKKNLFNIVLIISVRLANIMKELQLLPYQIHETEACRIVVKDYAQRCFGLWRKQSKILNLWNRLTWTQTIKCWSYILRPWSDPRKMTFLLLPRSILKLPRLLLKNSCKYQVKNSQYWIEITRFIIFFFPKYISK